MRRDCRGDSGEPGKCACVFSLLHARLRVHRAPGIPCALFIEGVKELKEFLQTSGAWRRENVDSCPVIASEAKQSSSHRVEGLDCFAFARNDGARHTSAISPRHASEVCKKFSRLRKKEGAGNAGCSMHPQPRVQKRKNARALTRFTGITPAFPAQWF